MTSVMAGIAMGRTARFTEQTPVYAFLGRPLTGAEDPRKSRITVGHLFTHSSGLACDDTDDHSPGNEDVMQDQSAQPDWYRYVLDLPLVHEPGTVYASCSGGINLVGAVIGRATGLWLPDFFDCYLARPLQISGYHVNLMPSLEAYAGGGLYLRPRDFAKFGQLYLDGGVWNGRRVVDRGWVERSTSGQIGTGDGASDGYGWHGHVLQAGGRRYREYEASGNGGQFLMVLPELDLVLVTTAGHYGQYGIWRTLRDGFVPE